ncbi:MAG: hypothetical protein GY866_41190 [Proteobacteria bacterium]|nr:hypothetical protein [Pseudomonadota bacterium]
MRIGRLAQGLIVLIWAATTLDVQWSAATAALAVFAIFGGACLFYGLFVIQAIIIFWSIETFQLMNAVTQGGIEAAQFPIAVYRAWLRKFLTFVVRWPALPTSPPWPFSAGRIRWWAVPSGFSGAPPSSGCSSS